MILRAVVKEGGKRSRHFIGHVDPHDGPVKDERMKPAACLEIHAEDDLFYLIRYAADGDFAGDTAHLTLDDARRQALKEYVVEANDWTETIE